MPCVKFLNASLLFLGLAVGSKIHATCFPTDPATLATCIIGGGTIDLAGGTITLTTAYSGTQAVPGAEGPTGTPDILTSVTIQNGLINTSAAGFRILHVGSGGVLSLNNLELSNGQAPSGFNGGAIALEAGGILDSVDQVTFRANSADNGGAIWINGVQ